MINGTPINITEYPYIGRIIMHNSNGIQTGCFGFKIDTQYFATAAHCLYDDQGSATTTDYSNINKPSNTILFSLRSGYTGWQYDLNPLEFIVSRAHYTSNLPYSDLKTRSSDIAVILNQGKSGPDPVKNDTLHYDRTFSINKYLSNHNNVPATVFGRNKNDSSGGATIYSLTTTIYSKEQCHNITGYPIPAGTFCMLFNTHDSSQGYITKGDSGSPVIMRRGGGNQLIGILSSEIEPN